MLLYLYAEHVTIDRNISEYTGETIDGERLNLGKSLRIIIPVVFGIISLVGIPGNGAIIYLTFRRKFTFDNVNTALVTFLACADVCFVMLCLPFDVISLVTTTWHFGDTLCKLVNYVMYVDFMMTSSVLTLMVYDRFLVIKYPLSTIRIRRTRNMLLAMLCISIVVLIVNVPTFFLYNVLEYNYNGEMTSVCAPSTSGTFTILSLNLIQIHYLTFGFVSYVMPLLLMSSMFGRICVTLIDKKKKKTFRPGYLRNDVDFTSVKFVFIISLAFFICWTPAQISLFLVRVMRYPSAPVSLYVIAASVAALCLAYSKICINPVIYTWLSAGFRQRVLCCWRYETGGQNSPRDTITRQSRTKVTGPL